MTTTPEPVGGTPAGEDEQVGRHLGDVAAADEREAPDTVPVDAEHPDTERSDDEWEYAPGDYDDEDSQVYDEAVPVYDEDEEAPVYGGIVETLESEDEYDEGGWNGNATRWDLVSDDNDIEHLVLTNEPEGVSIAVPLNGEIIRGLCAFTGYYPQGEDSALARSTGWAAWRHIWDDMPASGRTLLTWAVPVLIVVLVLFNIVRDLL